MGKADFAPNSHHNFPLVFITFTFFVLKKSTNACLGLFKYVLGKSYLFGDGHLRLSSCQQLTPRTLECSSRFTIYLYVCMYCHPCLCLTGSTYTVRLGWRLNHSVGLLASMVRICNHNLAVGRGSWT